MNLRTSLLLAAAICVVSAATVFAQNGQTYHSGSILLGTAPNTMLINPPTGGGASTFTFPSSSLSWPAANAAGFLSNDGSGGLTWATPSGLTLPYSNTVSSASPGLQIGNTGTGLGIEGDAASNSSAGLKGTNTIGDGVDGFAGIGSGAAGVFGQSSANPNSIGVYANGFSTGAALAAVQYSTGPVLRLVTSSSTSDILANNWSISHAGITAGVVLGMPYGPPAQDPGAGGLFTISNNGVSGYALGGVATAGGIALVGSSSNTGIGILAQNTSSGIALKAYASGAGPAIQAMATSTNDALDAYGNVQILGTGGGGTGGPTNASLYVPYGDITVGNHYLSSNVPGVAGVAQNTNTNLTLTIAPVGTDAAGRITLTTGAFGIFNASVTVTYAAPYAAGSYPVVVLTPNAAVTTACQLLTSNNSSFKIFVSGTDGNTVQSIKINYMVMGQNQ
jgi:hypothetical protein